MKPAMPMNKKAKKQCRNIKATYMFLNTQLLEFDKFGASGLQVETTSRFVGGAVLAGTHDEGHEGGGLNLGDKTTL